MHEAALAYFNFTGDYSLRSVEPAQLKVEIDCLIDEGINGFNVTIPHKTRVYALVDRRTPEAMRARAVNTAKVLQGRRLIGHNTDIGGLISALCLGLRRLYQPDADLACAMDRSDVLKQDFDALVRAGKVSTDTACVIGAGGASRAALNGLVALGYRKILVAARNKQKADDLVKEFKSLLPELIECYQVEKPRLSAISISESDLHWVEQLADLSLIINCTPIGQTDDALPDWLLHLLENLSPKSIVFDLVYAKGARPTPIVEKARDHNLGAFDGLDMLVYQAVEAFQFWTGHEPPAQVMKDALLVATGRSI